MNGETFIWFLSAFLFVPLSYADSQYECGAHGRFEYCIDGIPGCVIGCHCHPGYYFDTDTKICEPNIKLTQDFRRHYFSEPTRVHGAPITESPEILPASTTSNAVDEKIDEIAKDADDLGDWLYNQFFKTIENQVINKTQGEELPPTRRSGNILIKKPVRRSHKYWNVRKKKKKKSKSLKRKLLRITEDDSLFDSDSGYSSNEDSSSSSESDASRSVDEKGDKKKDDHGHKKIIIFNKKPQPPLPSFIFLPNMDTPYYPPIGLPPPPAMPMYPMVPVPPMVPGPPMGGPLFPYPGVPVRCDEDDVTTSAASTASTSATISSSEPTASTAATVPSAPTTSTTSEPEPTVDNASETEAETTTDSSPPLRLRHKKRNKSIGRADNEKGVPIHPMMRGSRNRLFKQLREKLNRKNKLESYFADQYQDLDAPLYGNDPLDFLPKHNLMRPNVNEMPSHSDVDFKYLAELIHKADLNKTLNYEPIPTQQNINIPEIEPVGPPPSRRNYNPNNNENNRPVNTVIRQRSRMEDPNDSFYTNLGKQIASMIRKIDSKGEREVNIEIEGANSKPKSLSSPVFNENNYSSRSFWERSVRSPLNHLGSFRHEMDHLKKSNEDLFSLENKVEIVASTAPTLSLHDLENIISTVEKVQLKPKRSNLYSEKGGHSNASFKLNLLPENVHAIHAIPKSKPVQSFVNKVPDFIHEVNTRRKHSDANSFLLSNFRQLPSDYNNAITNTETGKDYFRNMVPTRMPSVSNKPIAVSPATHLITNIRPSFLEETVDKTNLKYQPSPVLMNQRSLNHYTHYNNPYLFENAVPIPVYTGLSKNLVPYGNDDKPSYFHHEFHHFDYFD